MLQSGVMKSSYRGVRYLKSPLDLGIYLQLLFKLRPQTVIEIGAKFGGSALFFSDMLSADGIGANVVSVDIQPQVDFTDPRIKVLTGDALQLADSLRKERLASLSKPWLVVEDSAHFYETSLAVLEFFDQWLVSGDYIVVEDGIVSQLPGSEYAMYEDGPNRAVAACP